jgi:hypothetical protein
MREAGYTGHFSLDVDAESLSAGDDDEVMKKLEEAKAFLEKYFN